MTPFDHFETTSNHNPCTSFCKLRMSSDSDDSNMDRENLYRYKSRNGRSSFSANSEETVKSSSDENDSDCDDFEFDESSLFEYEYQCDKKPKFGHELEIDEDFTFSLDTLRLDEVDLDDFNGRNSMMASFDQLERDSSVTSLPIEIKFADLDQDLNSFHSTGNSNTTCLVKKPPLLHCPSNSNNRHRGNAFKSFKSCAPRHEDIYTEMKNLSRASSNDNTTSIFGELPSKKSTNTTRRRFSSNDNNNQLLSNHHHHHHHHITSS